jgi:hypothetical protein
MRFLGWIEYKSFQVDIEFRDSADRPVRRLPKQVAQRKMCSKIVRDARPNTEVIGIYGKQPLSKTW